MLRKCTPVGLIRQLRATWASLPEIARQTGTTAAVVRRVVGKLDREGLRQRQEEIARKIDGFAITWSEKVEAWREQTGQSEATFWRVLQRAKEGGGREEQTL